MPKKSLAIVTVVLLCTTAYVYSETPEFTEPSEHHEWLEQLEGRWETHAETKAMGEMPAMECTSTMNGRMLGKFWIVMDTEGNFGEIESKIMQTIGYDSKKKKYVATWIDNMSEHMYIYEGSVDKSGKKLTLETEGPNFLEDGKTGKFRDSYEFKTPDLIISTSEVMGSDGKWVTFVNSESRRVKK